MNVPLDPEEFTADFFNHGRDDAVLVDVGGRDPIAVKGLFGSGVGLTTRGGP